MSGPLSGYKVIEFAGLGPTPFSTCLLADFGADVVRIDRPGKPMLVPKYDFYNRNKRSIVLDLKKDEDQQTAHRMVEQADILVEGYRPGVMERLGFGPDICLVRNPRLVYGRMTGWGQSGPMAMEAGHDINYLAMTGALLVTGHADREPTPALNLVADLGGGAMYLLFGILAAVLEAQKSGKGQVVDAAMIDGVSHLSLGVLGFLQQGSWTTSRQDNLVDGGAPFYRAYRTSDGNFVSVGAIEPQFYAALVAALGQDFASLPDRDDRANWAYLNDLFATIFAGKTREEWIAIMTQKDACFSPVLSYEEARSHPQFNERNVYQTLGGLHHPAPAPRLSRTPGELRMPPPEPGQHSEEVRRAWKLDPI
ncbi:CaiB/BaiF CoA transferase family protein [Mesorhizobium australicum]|uniref:Alpha-methylacyl-CoA racemase n=1 Tax=Mesorhizobium australicum TaxID=536018 RepID=A0A1X7NG84_9HYPH|nr:CaiB/BaiF CoA-transferase family protein [Mesorhizobium australicum]SMH36350.1 alpha-methylacyl-CoA racemase [Mesorhizobium australicum]